MGAGGSPGELRRVLLACRATVGQVGNSDHANQSGGAGRRSRWLGKRPTVRGSAMNPVDHPAAAARASRRAGATRSPRVGRADPRQVHAPQAQGAGQADRPRPPPRQGEEALDEPQLEEGPVETRLMSRIEAMNAGEKRMIRHLVACLDDLP